MQGSMNKLIDIFQNFLSISQIMKELLFTWRVRSRVNCYHMGKRGVTSVNKFSIMSAWEYFTWLESTRRLTTASMRLIYQYFYVSILNILSAGNCYPFRQTPKWSSTSDWDVFHLCFAAPRSGETRLKLLQRYFLSFIGIVKCVRLFLYLARDVWELALMHPLLTSRLD